MKTDGNGRENMPTVSVFIFLPPDRNENKITGNKNDNGNVGNPKTEKNERIHNGNGR